MAISRQHRRAFWIGFVTEFAAWISTIKSAWPSVTLCSRFKLTDAASAVSQISKTHERVSVDALECNSINAPRFFHHPDQVTGYPTPHPASTAKKTF
jgi:hypothetical protein